MDFTSLTPEQVLDLGKPTKEFEEILKNYKPQNLDVSDPLKALAKLRSLVTAFEQIDKPDPDVTEETLQAPSRDGELLPLKVFRAASTAETSPPPLIVLYFPGGFTMGSPTVMAPFARTLVKRFSCTVIAPTYRLAPEHPFPIAFNDGWDTLSWISSHTSDLHVDASKGFISGGISSGANICNAIAHQARDSVLQPPLTGVWLGFSGIRLRSTDTDLLPRKYKERLLSRTQDSCVNSVVQVPAISKMHRAFLNADPESQLYSPLIWRGGGERESGEFGHKDYPRAYFQVAGMEPSRDEELIFEDMLKNEGIETRCDLYRGLPHAFWVSFRELPESKGWEDDTLGGLGWLLGV